MIYIIFFCHVELYYTNHIYVANKNIYLIDLILLNSIDSLIKAFLMFKSYYPTKLHILIFN